MAFGMNLLAGIPLDSKWWAMQNPQPPTPVPGQIVHGPIMYQPGGQQSYPGGLDLSLVHFPGGNVLPTPMLTSQTAIPPQYQQAAQQLGTIQTSQGPQVNWTAGFSQPGGPMNLDWGSSLAPTAPTFGAAPVAPTAGTAPSAASAGGWSTPSAINFQTPTASSLGQGSYGTQPVAPTQATPISAAIVKAAAAPKARLGAGLLGTSFDEGEFGQPNKPKQPGDQGT